MSLWDKVRYRLDRWRALGGAYRSSADNEALRTIFLQQTAGSMTQGPVPGARYDDSDTQRQDDESRTES